jgi:aspartyl aminopeptidase
VPYQPFTNRSDTRGGATLGMISTTHVSVPTVDIGAAQWAMHSAYETAGCKDTEYLVKSMKEFYEMEFVIDNMQVTFK